MNERSIGAVLIAVSAIAFIAAAGGWLGSEEADPPARAAPGEGPSLQRLEQIGSGLAAASEAQSGGGFPGMKDVVPRGLTAAQWQVLQDSLKDHPQAAQELARIAEFFGSKADFDAFDAIRAQDPNDRRLAAMARGLLPKVDLHLQRGELTGGDAMALRAELLQHTEPDETRRAEEMAQWRARQAALVPAAAAPDPGFVAYRRAEEQRVAQYKALPESQRDPAALARQVQALRNDEQ